MEIDMHPEKKVQIITAILMSAFMSLLLSGFFSWLNLGFTLIWLKAWAIGFSMGWPLALGTVLIVGRPIRQLAIRLAK
jgi:hypothetical protein